jgi:signal recognition particle receptor subunit beta
MDPSGDSASDAARDAFVFGRMILPEGNTIRLCGVPDQDIADVRRTLGPRAQGLVLLIDGSARDPVLALERFLDRFADICREGSAVIGITRTDLRASAVNLHRYRQCVRRRQRMIPIYEVDARDRVQMLVLLAALIEMIRLRTTESDAD